MKNETEQNILFYDTYSVLVINGTGRIRRLYTPFKVLCTKAVDDLHQNTSLFVDEVFEDPDDLLLYKINGNLYAYKYFTIQIKF